VLLASTLGSWLLLGDRPDGNRIGGIALSIAGIGAIGWDSFSSGDAGSRLGDLAFVAGGLLWASYTVASRAWSIEPVHGTALVSVLSMTIYLPIYALWNGTALLAAPAPELLLQAGYQGLLAGVFALMLYTRTIAILGSGRSALFAALVPSVAAAMAYPVLGEQPSSLAILGIGLVSLGMASALGLWRLFLQGLIRRADWMATDARSSRACTPQLEYAPQPRDGGAR
jgi:drug/metabolite transporter (DMT)-like permease